MTIAGTDVTLAIIVLRDQIALVTHRRGYLIFRARAQQGLQQALEEGLASPEEALPQCRALLRSLAAARMPHRSLSLEGLGWDGERVILLEVRRQLMD